MASVKEVANTYVEQMASQRPDRGDVLGSCRPR